MLVALFYTGKLICYFNFDNHNFFSPTFIIYSNDNILIFHMLIFKKINNLFLKQKNKQQPKHSLFVCIYDFYYINIYIYIY